MKVVGSCIVSTFVIIWFSSFPILARRLFFLCFAAVLFSHAGNSVEGTIHSRRFLSSIMAVCSFFSF